MLEAIQNANDVGIVVRINCTVTQDNYLYLKRFVDIVKSFDVFEVNFLTLNYWEDAGKQVPIDYNVVTPKIHEAIDLLKDFCIVNVRYTPYCYMVGYEKYVCNYYQHIYDIYDWNIAVYDCEIAPNVYKADPIKALYAEAKENRSIFYKKPGDCMKCKHFYICDGIEKKIDIKVIPQDGEKILDPIFYRDGYYD
jgi:MoaA/NifB/PqqE/SkfB family radical SAM enzyme